ncbi:hypothetical protein RSOL_280490, partial [Rhizoctonia solani AG-3 Rhs1AP]
MPPRSTRDRPARGPRKRYTPDDFEEPPSKKKKTQDDDYEFAELSAPEDHIMDSDVVRETSPLPGPSSVSKPRAKRTKQLARSATRPKKSKSLAPINRETLRILMDHSAHRRSQTPVSAADTSADATTTADTTLASKDSDIIDLTFSD